MTTRKRHPVRIALLALGILVLLRGVLRRGRPPMESAVDEPPAVEQSSVPVHPQTRVGRFTGFYGAHPLHLLVLVASFTLTAYAVLLLSQKPDTVRIGIWFVAAVIAHDLVLFPLYALADRSVSGLLGWRARRRKSFTVPAINYLRTPVLASGLLLIVFFPAILGQGASTFTHKSDLVPGSMYLDRWLLLTGSFFLLAAICYAARCALVRGPVAVEDRARWVASARDRDERPAARHRPPAGTGPS